MDDDDPPGVPEWVVTYGDMMSLLLTFFIMLVSLSEVVADKKYRAILDALQKHRGYAGAPPAPPGKNFPLNSVIKRMEIPQLGSSIDTDLGTGGVRRKSTSGDDIRIFKKREGHSLRVGEFLEFETDSSEITPRLNEQLEQIAIEIAGKPQKIEVRAHIPMSGMNTDQISDSYQVALERCQVIQQSLEKLGIDHSRISLVMIPEAVSTANEERKSIDITHAVEVISLDEFAETYTGD